MTKNHESEESLKQAMDELGRARESVRLKLHLLSLDARTAWHDLESRAQSLQDKLEDKGEKATETAAHKALELATSVRKFVESHL